MPTYGPFEIVSGVSDQYVYFDAGVSGISSFTVNRARNATSFTAMTTPTVSELGSTGIYALLLDEDMTVGAGNITEQMVFRVQATGMEDVTIFVQLRANSNDEIGVANLDEGALQQIVDDLENGGRLDLLIDAIKVVTDNLPNAGALTDLAQASDLTTVDTVVDAIKAKTDQLTFTVANQVDANTESLNGTAVVGDGSSGDKWRAV